MECLCPILERTTLVDETGFCRDSWSVVRCRETGFVFLANPPDYSQLESQFAWEKTSTVESKRREAEEPIVSSVSSFAKTVKSIAYPRRNKIASLTFSVARDIDRTGPINLLDVGCGWGSLMVEIHDRFAQIGQQVVPYGIEVSKQMAAQSDAIVTPLGGRVLATNALDGFSHFGPASIHVAIMCSYLEHECRPLSVLRRLHSILTACGVVVLKVPNFACWNRMLRGRKWCGFRFPDHVSYFTPQTFQRLAQEAGFVVSRQTFLDKFPLSDNMYAVLRKNAEPTHPPGPAAGSDSNRKSSPP